MNVSRIIEEYNKGSSLATLAKKYNKNPRAIKKILIEGGVKIRSQKEQNKFSPQNQRKYSIDDNFLDIIDNPDKAYLLGFLAADGAIQPDGSIKLALSTKDRELLCKIQQILQTNYPIRDSTTKEGYDVSTFVFRSAKIREQLEKYGIVRRKTYSFTFPYSLPQNYWIDFIRGYWDGDGTVCVSNGYARTSLCSYQKEFLDSVINILWDKYQIPKVNIYNKKGTDTWYFQYSINSSKKLYQAFYKEKENYQLFLARKYSKFVELFGEINPHEPATSQAEDGIV